MILFFKMKNILYVFYVHLSGNTQNILSHTIFTQIKIFFFFFENYKLRHKNILISNW